MAQTLTELHRERGRLHERIAAQRLLLARQAAPLTRALNAGDRFRQTLHDGKNFALAHPLALGVAAAAVFVIKPGAALRWVGRGLSLWRTWQSVQRLLPPGLLSALWATKRPS